MRNTEYTVFALGQNTLYFHCISTQKRGIQSRTCDRSTDLKQKCTPVTVARENFPAEAPKMAIYNELEALLASKSVRKKPQIEWVRSCRPAMTTYQVLYYWCPVPRLDSPGPCLSAVFALFFTLFLLVARKQLFFAVLLGPLAVLPI